MSNSLVQTQPHSCRANPMLESDWIVSNSFPISCFMQHSAWLYNSWSKFHESQIGVSSSSLCRLTVCNEKSENCGQSLWFRQFSRGLNWWRQVGCGAICSDYVALPSFIGCESQVAEATARWFSHQPRKLLDIPIAIEIEGHEPSSIQWQVFFRTLEDCGWVRDSVRIESAWRVELPANWQEYELQLSKSRRRKVRRALKLAESGELTLGVYSTPDQIVAAWPEFVRLHQMRRQQLGQPGVFADSQFERFLKSTSLDLAREEICHLCILYQREVAIAAILVFETADCWFVYQSGLDTAKLELEPGHMVNSLMIKQAMQRGIKFVDFLRGDEPYKRGWHADRKELHRTILLPPGLTSRGIASALKIKRSLRAWLSKKRSDTTSKEDE